MATTKLEVKFDPEDYAGVHETIGQGIVYWACELEPEEWDQVNEQDPAPTQAVVEQETGRVITWSDSDLDDMAAKALTLGAGTYPAAYIVKAVAAKDEHGFLDAGEIDSDAADIMLQCWVFGEVIYG